MGPPADMSESPRRPLHERSDSKSNSNSYKSNNSSQNSFQNKNISTTSAAPIRLVPQTPPQLLGTSSRSTTKLNEAKAITTSTTFEENQNLDTHVRPKDAIYSRTPLPTHPSHFLLAPGKGKDPALATEFRTNPQAQETRQLSGSSVLPAHSTHSTPQLPRKVNSDTGAPISKVKPPAKKRLQIHKDNQTFSLLHDDRDPQPTDASSQSSPILGLSRASSYDSLGSEARHAPGRSNSIESCLPSAPATPSPAGKKHPIIADPISTSSPWNYELVGGIRKVPKTPDLKKKAASDSPLPPVPEASDRPSAASHDLSTKLSFQSTQTTSSTTTVSETSNYKVYTNTFASTSDVALAPPSTSDSNYQLIGPPSEAPTEPSENYQLIGPPSEAPSEPSSNIELIGPPSETSSNYPIIGPSSNASTTSSVVHRPYTARSETISENENYELYGDSSLAESSTNLVAPHQKFSHESLVVPPLRPKTNTRSNEHLGYYKSRSRESLRTGSLTSITTVLSQQEASRAIVGSGSLITLPILNERSEGSSSWAESSGPHPPRSYMNEHPHQWSSQLSTVLSVTEGSDTAGRLSRDWASESGRRSNASGFPSTPSDSRRGGVLSISSSLALEEARSESLEPPEPAFARNGRRHQSSGSIQFVENQDEYGDGITDMQDLRNRPSRTRLSGFFSVTSSDNGRTNTMRSTSSSRANSMLASATIPTWARLYYGSGERKYLGAPGSSTESTTGSRASSFRSGSPNTDHFPLSIYSPRRRPRERGQANTRPSTRGSMEINPAPLGQDEGFVPRYRAWSVSSIWSPHLRMDRRAARHSVWDPPSVNWSADGSSFGRRNIQIIMFVIGFIFPFSWMIASFLPLPLNPISEMRERDAGHSASQLGASASASEHGRSHDYDRRFGPIDEKRFENARWWRNLNRWMSLVGVLIIVAIVVLVVVSIRQGWTTTATT